MSTRCAGGAVAGGAESRVAPGRRRPGRRPEPGGRGKAAVSAQAAPRSAEQRRGLGPCR